MTIDKGIWYAAAFLIRRRGARAKSWAANRAERLLDEGDVNGVATWLQIVAVIDLLRDETPEDGQRVH